MEGHIVGTGVSVPSPLQAKCFGKAGKAGKRLSKGRVSSVTVVAAVHFPPQTLPLMYICSHTDTEQEPADSLTKS